MPKEVTRWKGCPWLQKEYLHSDPKSTRHLGKYQLTGPGILVCKKWEWAGQKRIQRPQWSELNRKKKRWQPCQGIRWSKESLGHWIRVPGLIPDRGKSDQHIDLCGKNRVHLSAWHLIELSESGVQTAFEKHRGVALACISQLLQDLFPDLRDGNWVSQDQYSQSQYEKKREGSL